MSNYTYINTVPRSILFTSPKEEGSTKIITVSFSDVPPDRKSYVTINDGNHEIFVNIENIDWLREALSDVKQIIKMNKP